MLSFSIFNFPLGFYARIVGGENAPRSYPYQISLQLKPNETIMELFGLNSSDYFHICGGSIVSENCVVTAAHCVIDFRPQDLSILAGTNKLNAPNAVRYFTDTFTVHPNYTVFVTGDIAVINIKGKFNYGPKIAPITYSQRFVGARVNCTLTG